MKSFSFIHAADLHLGTPFKGLGACGQEWQERLREAPFRAFENIIQLCLDQEVDFLVLAGDVYDSSQHNLRAQIRFRDGLTRLSQRGISTYIVRGNHDYADDTDSHFKWPESVFFFPAGEVGSQIYCKDGEEVAELLGISYPEQNPTQNYIQAFQKKSPIPYTIGILHSNVGGQEGYDNYAPCNLADLRSTEVDYWALGHVHRKLVLSTEQPVIAYPGPPQGRSSRETGVKGCFLVEVNQGRTQTKFVPTAEVSRERFVFDISSWAQLDDLFYAVDEGVQGSAGSADYLVARIELTGRGPLHQELVCQQNCQEILESLRSRNYSRWQGVYLDELLVNTEPDVDKEAERNSGTITADYLTALDGLAREEGHEEVAQVLETLYHSKYRRYLEIPQGEELLEILRRAENTGLDLLIGEED